MGRIYIVRMDNVTIAGSPTLCWINPGTSRSLRVFRASISQGATTTAQMVIGRLSRQVSAFPTLTSSAPVPVDSSDAASAITGATNGAAGTSGINASAEGAGAKTAIGTWSFLNTAGLDLWFPRDESIVLPASSTSGLSLHLVATPSSLLNWSAQLWFEEV